MTPQHIFVAHFIGESNFLEGYVSKTTGNKSIIELRGGLFVHTLDRAHKKGDKVVIAIRPEILTVEKGKKRRVNSLFGHVEGFRFEGTNVRCQIRLENGELVVVFRPALVTEWFNVDEKVTVSFSAEKSLVFSYPKRGLKRELALE